jgi:hypothetical protein
MDDGGQDCSPARSLSEHAFAMGSKPPELVSADPRSKGGLSALPVEPDSRWQDMMIGAKEDLEREASSWEQGSYVPQDIKRMFSVSRELFVHSYFIHEFAAVACRFSQTRDHLRGLFLRN